MRVRVWVDVSVSGSMCVVSVLVVVFVMYTRFTGRPFSTLSVYTVTFTSISHTQSSPCRPLSPANSCRHRVSL